MEYRIISDITALSNAVMSGVVNFSNEIPPKDWATIQTNPDLVGKTIEGSRYYWLLPNNEHPPLMTIPLMSRLTMSPLGVTSAVLSKGPRM